MPMTRLPGWVVKVRDICLSIRVLSGLSLYRSLPLALKGRGETMGEESVTGQSCVLNVGASTDSQGGGKGVG